MATPPAPLHWTSDPIHTYPPHRYFRPRSASASARTRFSGIDDGDGLDLDHEIGSGEPGDADGRAGRGRHPEIAHADVGALLELVEVGDKGVGLDDFGPGGAGRLETPVEVLEGLLHLRPHVAFADAVAVDVAGQLAGGIDDLAAAAHRHDVRVGRLSVRHSDIHAFRLKPLDL